VARCVAFQDAPAFLAASVQCSVFERAH
jgi:hypothetical protein